MAEISRTALFGKLNPLAYKAVESATTFCRMRGNPYVEPVHWFHQILQQPDSDLHRILRHFDLDEARLARDFVAALDRLPSGATSISDLSVHLEELMQEAWLYASLLFSSPQVRTGHLLVAMLRTSSLRSILYGMSGEFHKVKVETLTDEFSAITAGSPEEGLRATDGTDLSTPSAPPLEGEAGAVPSARIKALARYSIDLTEKARRGEIDPVVGRDEEIRQIVDILLRRRQNNPLLTGEAGVGKTAVVEGFALRIAAGDVPAPLRDVSLRALDVGLLQAGASVRGEFENRLRQVIEEVQSSERPIILFIDEAHTLIGAGGAAGTGDAANLLKPALARGTLRTIAATTWGEYKKYIEKDPALTRRFQVIQVAEPDESKAVLMLRGVAPVLEKHHAVWVLDRALEESVRLSRRYIPARQLPDKAVSVLDTACARVAISQQATPAPVEDARRRIEALERELEIANKEAAAGFGGEARIERITTELAGERERLEALETRWREEQSLVDQILDLRQRLAAAEEDTDRDALLRELERAQARLAEIQGESPLILPAADDQAVASVIADWTGIPVGRMVRDEIRAVLKLAETLRRRVLGQDHALETIAKRIQTARARLDNPNKPIGVFLLAGPSGVGKTETALALAEALYGGEENLITINMSEFQEAHTVSTLKGAPPGYVGYGEGGILTEAVRRRPYSVVLLDEIEKAHPDVHEIFFQVFDKGWMEDAEGRYIDFRNTVILLTTNAGTERIMALCQDPELMPEPDAVAKALREPLLKVFPPALLGRLVVIPYYPLRDELLRDIIRLQLSRIQKRIEENHGVSLEYDDAVVDLVLSRCHEVESGARMIDAILSNTLLAELSRLFLERLMEGLPPVPVRVGVQDEQFVYTNKGS